MRGAMAECVEGVATVAHTVVVGAIMAGPARRESACEGEDAGDGGVVVREGPGVPWRGGESTPPARNTPPARAVRGEREGSAGTRLDPVALRPCARRPCRGRVVALLARVHTRTWTPLPLEEGGPAAARVRGGLIFFFVCHCFFGRALVGLRVSVSFFHSLSFFLSLKWCRSAGAPARPGLRRPCLGGQTGPVSSAPSPPRIATTAIPLLRAWPPPPPASSPADG